MSRLNPPLVSVIVPIYNVELFLNKCIDSIISQTYYNLEIILVNDGSTDHSLEICQSYKDSRIIIVNKSNGGLSSARNAGLDVMSGDYIFFLDSDDWIEEDCIEVLVNEIESNFVDIIQCQFLSTIDDQSIITKNDDLKIEVLTNIEALKSFHHEVNTITWNKLYKSFIFKTLRFPEGKIHEDHFTTYKAVFLAKKIAIINQSFIYYRQRANSIMSSSFSKKRLDIIEAQEEKVNFMLDFGDIELYKLALLEYTYRLINSYEMYKHHFPQDSITLLQLQEKAKILNNQILRTNISVKNKLKFVFFAYFPKSFIKFRNFLLG